MGGSLSVSGFATWCSYGGADMIGTGSKTSGEPLVKKRAHGCMHGCTSAWMHAWAHKCMDPCMGAHVHGCVDESGKCMSGCVMLQQYQAAYYY